MATLAGGKYLGRSVDVDAMADRAVTEPGFFVWVTNAVGEPPGAALAHRTPCATGAVPAGCCGDRGSRGSGAGLPRPGAYSLPAMVGFSPTEPTGIGSGGDGHAVRADLPAAQPAWPPRTPTAPTTPLPVATADPEPAAYLPDDVPSEPPLFDPTGLRPEPEHDRWRP